jgi:hypothetical protein
MDLLFSDAYGGYDSDSGSVSLKGLFDLQAVSGGDTSTVPTATFAEDNATYAPPDEEVNAGDGQNMLQTCNDYSQDDTVKIEYSPAQVDILSKLEQTTRSLFPPDDTVVFGKDEL